MNKAELRKVYKAKRAALSAAERNKREDLALIQFQKMDIVIPSVIMTYASSEAFQEFNPLLIEDYCYFINSDQQLCYPIVNQDAGIMLSMKVNDDTSFAKSKFGIDEPVDGILIDPGQIEMILVPLLCFDMRGYRVGYGKGYYDKFLANCYPSAMKVGLSFFDAEPGIDDINEFDIPLDYCVTPDLVYHFKR